jgi:fructose-1,6-bisphosphatase/inositol monophosphatase family enzyme
MPVPNASISTASALAMEPAELLGLFDAAFDAQRAALAGLRGSARRARTDRPGQYALDVVADDAICAVLAPAGVAVVSEESGRSGHDEADITVVVDPVDGSTNCSRGIPYWAISLCAVDSEGALCALVANGATGERMTAVRGEGARCDGEPIETATTQRLADSVIAVDGVPDAYWGWRQLRALGSAALAICDVGAGRLDAWVEAHDVVAPWDYLGGMLVAREAGAVVVDAEGRELVVTDHDARRQVWAAATPELLAEIKEVVRT